MSEAAARSRRMLILGGTLHHPGGLEAFCARAAEAVNGAGAGWTADWWPTDTAYLTLGRSAGVVRRLHALTRTGAPRFDLIWLQWSTLSDLLFLLRARARGIPVLVTPHLGANARLQRIHVLRTLCAGILRAADRIGLLFAGQGAEIALPPGVPTSIVRTFLPTTSLTRMTLPRTGAGVRLIHAGRLSEGKGSFRTVALCAALRARGVPVAARIVGRSDDATMSRLRDMIADARMGDDIELIEWLDEERLATALAEADVLAHLSTLDSFPLIVLEAMAAGAVPVVGEMAGARSMIEAYGGHVARGTSVDDAADWIAGQSIAELRSCGAAIAARVRADLRWDECAAQAIAAAEATLAQRG